MNRAAILQGARARKTTAPFIDQETVKAVLSQTLDQSKLIIVNCGKFSSYSKDVDVKLNESSRYIYRCTVRELGKPSKVKNVISTNILQVAQYFSKPCRDEEKGDQ